MRHWCKSGLQANTVAMCLIARKEKCGMCKKHTQFPSLPTLTMQEAAGTPVGSVQLRNDITLFFVAAASLVTPSDAWWQV